MDKGWIKIHRKILNWEWYQNDKVFRVFFHLLLSANHEDKSWQGVKIRRGQIITGRKVLAKKLKISEQSIRTSLKHLKSTNEITIKTTSKYSIITILKWNDYQISTNKLTTNQPTTNHKQELKEVLPVKTGKNMKDFEEKIIDIENNEERTEKPPNIQKKMWELLVWAESRRGKKFLAKGKQFMALKKLRLGGISITRIKDKWIEMEQNDYWKGRGFDFMTLVNQFDKEHE